MCHCAATLNDGEIPIHDLLMVQAASGVTGQESVDELIREGLWDVVCNDVTNAVTAYRVHDYLEYNPPSARVFDSRAKTKERVDKWRKSNGNGVTNGVTNGVSNGTCNAAPVPVPVPLPDPVPVQEKKDPPLPPGGGKRVRRVSTASESFEKFYAAYPRHTARGAAEKAWPGDEHLPAILAALEWQAPEFRTRPYDKVPHPATWLNGERWKDEKPTQPSFQAPSRQYGAPQLILQTLGKLDD